jgi:hypothetical protein
MKRQPATAFGLSILLSAIIFGDILLALRHHESDVALKAALLHRTELEGALQRTRSATADLAIKRAVASSSVPTSNKASPQRRAQPVTLGALTARDPKLAQLFLNSVGARFDRDYGPFCEKMHLTAEQVQRLRQIQSAFQAQRQDISDAAASSGISINDPSVAELIKQTWDQRTADEVSLLGDAGLQQLQDYERTLSVRRELVQSLAGYVAWTDPLTADQANQMTQIIANASPAYRAGYQAGAYLGGNETMENETMDWEDVEAKLRPVLTPTQFAAWQQSPSRYELQMEVAYNQAVKADQSAAVPNGQ